MAIGSSNQQEMLSEDQADRDVKLAFSICQQRKAKASGKRAAGRLPLRY